MPVRLKLKYRQLQLHFRRLLADFRAAFALFVKSLLQMQGFEVLISKGLLAMSGGGSSSSSEVVPMWVVVFLRRVRLLLIFGSKLKA